MNNSYKIAPQTYVLVTGVAGFIGFHVCQKLLAMGYKVVGIDNLNDYYDVSLKHARLARLKTNENFEFHLLDIAENEEVAQFFAAHTFSYVVHLAAQAGVRYSLESPHTYIASNLVGFANVLEGCRRSGVFHLVFASSSSVYGANRRLPYTVRDNVDHPLSLYAATKKSNELMAHSYAHLYRLPVTGLRFFTVYGPWGRPDMAIFKFAASILAGKSIDVFNHGNMQRDFTYVDDVVNAIVALLENKAEPDPQWDEMMPSPATSQAPYRIFNIGNNQPIALMKLIQVLENALGKKANVNFLPMQPGDLLETYADIDALQLAVNFSPSTPIELGVKRFVSWYRQYYTG